MLTLSDVASSNILLNITKHWFLISVLPLREHVERYFLIWDNSSKVTHTPDIMMYVSQLSGKGDYILCITIKVSVYLNE